MSSMNILRTTLFAGAIAMAGSASADPAKPAEDDGTGTFFRPKVDNPLPDTYEPLGGTRWDEGEAHTQEIRESWELKKQAQEGDHPAQAKDSEEAPRPISPATQRIRIQESVPGAAPATRDSTVVEEGKDSLRIREQ
jgi:hypothetical protein